MLKISPEEILDSSSRAAGTKYTHIARARATQATTKNTHTRYKTQDIEYRDTSNKRHKKKQ